MYLFLAADTTAQTFHEHRDVYARLQQHKQRMHMHTLHLAVYITKAQTFVVLTHHMALVAATYTRVSGHGRRHCSGKSFYLVPGSTPPACYHIMMIQHQLCKHPAT